MHQFWDTQPVPREGVAPGEIEGVGNVSLNHPPPGWFYVVTEYIG